MKRIRFETLGCRLNHSETEVLKRIFEQHGYRLANEKENAEVCVVNTCTVTERGDAKNRQLIRALHRRHPEAGIAVVGCYAQMAADTLVEMNGVRLVVGSQEKMRLAEYMAMMEDDSRSTVVRPEINRRDFQAPVFPRNNISAGENGKPETSNGFRTRASLKIQDGCDFMCSFCIIPFARGRSRNRKFGNLMEEGEMLAREGVQEIVFTGVNIGTYREREKTLLDVIDSLNGLEGPARIRISSIEPTTVPDGVLERMADPQHKLAPFLHLPMQSGSDSILEAMKRRYRAKDFAGEVENAWKQVPGLCIGTDVMVGFPGETALHYQQTWNLLSELPFTYFHVFPFSARKGTPAFRLQGMCHPQEVRRRGTELRKLSMQKKQLFHERMLDTVEEVLFEAKKSDGTQSGYTPNYARVTLQSKGAEDYRNQILPVRINSIQKLQVFGSLEMQ